MDIVGLVFWAIYLGRKTLGKGYSKGKGVGIAVGFWLGLEIGLAMVGAIVSFALEFYEVRCLAFLLGVAGIGLGMLFSHLVVKNLPIRKAEVAAFLRSKQGSEKERRYALMALAELGQEALPLLVELYEQEMHWQFSSPAYRNYIIEAIIKAGGREYLEKRKRGEV
ncbi:hypothetical protein JXM67_14890 [candidate division WOR-3 bacterium]|nr:hypothetical protein [candidate division WOR-3 bacterium]